MKGSQKPRKEIDIEYLKKKKQDKRKALNMRKKRQEIQSMKNLSKA